MRGVAPLRSEGSLRKVRSPHLHRVTSVRDTKPAHVLKVSLHAHPAVMLCCKARHHSPARRGSAARRLHASLPATSVKPRSVRFWLTRLSALKLVTDRGYCAWLSSKSSSFPSNSTCQPASKTDLSDTIRIALMRE